MILQNLFDRLSEVGPWLPRIGPPPSTPSVLLLLHHRSSSFYTIGPPPSTPSVLLLLHHRSCSFYTIGPPPSTPSVLLLLHHRSSSFYITRRRRTYGRGYESQPPGGRMRASLHHASKGSSPFMQSSAGRRCGPKEPHHPPPGHSRHAF